MSLCGAGDQNSVNVSLVRVVRGDYKMSYTSGLLHDRLLACSEAYGPLGCPGSANILLQRRMSSFFKEPTAFLRGDPELQPQSKPDLPVHLSQIWSPCFVVPREGPSGPREGGMHTRSVWRISPAKV